MNSTINRIIGQSLRILESKALVFINLPYVSEQKLIHDLKDVAYFTKIIINLEEEKGAIKISFREIQPQE